MMGLSNSYALIMAVLVIIFLSVMNSISVKLGNSIQVVAGIVKLIPLAIIIIFGFIHGPSVGNGPANLIPFVSHGSNIASVLAGDVLATLFAYQD